MNDQLNLHEQMAALKEKLLTVLPQNHLGFIQGWISNYPDQKTRFALTALLGLLPIGQQSETVYATPIIAPNEQIVVLLHGIRTLAIWQNLVAEELGKIPGVIVFPVGYGWIDAVRFWASGWLPSQWLESERSILRELRDLKDRYPGVPLVIIAHSFSTHLLARIFNEHTDIKVSKLILCGAIVSRKYRWDKVSVNSGGMLVINEVGTRDIWPVMARALSWGYGCSGTMGFESTRVINRYFDYGHSDFFTAEHITSYWIPFLVTGQIVKSPWDSSRPSPSWVINAVASLPFIKIIISTILAIAIWGIYTLITFSYYFFNKQFT